MTNAKYMYIMPDPEGAKPICGEKTGNKLTKRLKTIGLEIVLAPDCVIVDVIWLLEM